MELAFLNRVKLHYINRAKKALKYSVKTAKELLLGQRKRNEEDTDETTESDDDSEQESSEDSKNENKTEVKIEVEEEPSNVSDGLEVYSKFDYVPGDKLMFYDDFSNDFIGDFPAKWNTNGSGEVVTLNKVSRIWFEFKQGGNTYFIPNLSTNLPENYTIEFDFIALGIN